MRALPAPLREAIAARGAGLTIAALRLGAMGDIVRTLPAVRLVRSALPLARIHWVAWEPWTEILRDHPDLDGTIGLSRSELRRLARSPLTWPALLAAARRAAARVRAARADLILDFHADLRTGLLGWLSGAPVRLGYSGHQQKEGNALFTTHRVPPGERRRSRIDRNLDLVRALGLPDAPLPSAGIGIDAAAEERARSIAGAFVSGDRPYAIVNPGASQRQAYKKPPPSLLAAALHALAEQGVSGIIVSGPGEDADAAAVADAAGGTIPRAPATSLPELAALLARARLFIGGDSGPLHLACGVGCPVVAIYGPTDPIVNGPWRVPFEVVVDPARAYTGIKSADRRSGGFEGIAPAAVATAVHRLLTLPRDAALIG
jgi:ADP-heptose:LPS heptosyltransferase